MEIAWCLNRIAIWKSDKNYQEILSNTNIYEEAGNSLNYPYLYLMK